MIFKDAGAVIGVLAIGIIAGLFLAALLSANNKRR